MNGTSKGERQQQTCQDKLSQAESESCHNDVDADGVRRKNRIDLRRVKWSLIRKAIVCAIMFFSSLYLVFVISGRALKARGPFVGGVCIFPMEGKKKKGKVMVNINLRKHTQNGDGPK